MATNPTRLQRQARENLSQALYLITEASRLDGKSALAAADLAEIARRIAPASSAFDLDSIVVGALERRGNALGLRADAVELLTLLEADIKPLDMLLLSDAAFKELAARVEVELGEV